MNAENLNALFSYNHYANHLVMDIADLLTETEFTCRSSPSHGSVYNLLIHMQRAEAFFLSACKENPLTTYPDMTTVADIRCQWDILADEINKFLSALYENDSDRIVPVTIKEKQYNFPIWQLLMQALLHSNHHRGELSIVLTELGHPLPTLDSIIYFAEQSNQQWV